MTGEFKFPKQFLWGTATSPTQVEGHVVNEWTDFLAEDGGHCRIACNHYHRYEEDVELMGGLGVNAYRMGIEWSRLQAEPFGELNKTELDRYLHLLDCLKSSGITPMVVLHHFSNPQWINAIGGWTNSKTVEMFVDYVTRLVSVLKDRVSIWNTFNEPDTYASLTYLLGGFPPKRKWNFPAYRKVIKQMAAAHVRVSEIIRRNGNGAKPPEVGIAKNWTFFSAFKPYSLWDHSLAAVCHYLFNHFVADSFLGGERVKASTYVGLNYYGRARLHHFQPLIPASGASAETLKKFGIVCDDMVERYPEGFGHLLRQFHQRFKLPVYVTEHGSASGDHEFRIRDLKAHLKELQDAMKHGVDVRGFFYWSLLDNFEWQFGYTKKFGLLSVDFSDENLPRKMTPVAEFYRSITRNGGR